MISKNVLRRFGVIVIASIFMALIAVPNSIKNYLPDTGVSDWLKERNVQLGLDLQGGVQLDFRVDLRQAEAYNSDDDPDNDVDIDELIDGVKDTLVRRTDFLGVSEPQVYTADIADEKHIIVELAGIHDVDEAKQTIGKTIQLEFKVQKEDFNPATYEEDVRRKADDILQEALQDKKEFKIIGAGVQTPDSKVNYSKESWFQDKYKGDMSKVWDAPLGQVFPEVIQDSQGFVFSGQALVEEKGYFVVKPISKEVVEREVTEPGEDFDEVAKEVSAEPDEIDIEAKTQAELPEELAPIWDMVQNNDIEAIERNGRTEIYKKTGFIRGEEKIAASHILISYAGSEATGNITRTKEEAKTLADELLERVKAPAVNFGDLALEYSDDPSARTASGSLGTFGKGAMVAPFEEAAFALGVGEISGVVETPFGYHIIKKDAEFPAEADKAEFKRIVINHDRDDVQEYVAQVVERLSKKEFTRDEEQLTAEYIFFSTLPDEWQPTGLDGKHFRRARVSFDQINNPLVLIEFDDEGAQMFEDLTEQYVGKPMAIFVGGVLISAPRINEKISGGTAQITGQYTVKEANELKNNLNTGAIAAPVLLEGQHQIGATLGEESLAKSLDAALIGLIILAIYMILYYRLLGLLADLALLIYTTIIVFILKSSSLVDLNIIMTLAGIAGIILSIGMAVDANVLIFERLKEEIRTGKNLSAAIQAGFDRAWTSIRDSNLTTLLICAILAWFGGSTLIRGFAIMLAIGVTVSMFTAITITRTFLQMFEDKDAAKWGWLFGVSRRD